MIQVHLLAAISLFLVSTCAKTSRPFATNEAYKTPDGKTWAYGDLTLGKLSLPPMESGVMLENNDAGKPISAESKNFSLLRAMDGSSASAQNARNDLVFADLHPDKPGQYVAYAYGLRFDVNGSEVQIQAVLIQAGPTYKNALGAPSKIVPIGVARFSGQNDRAYVKLNKSLRLAEVTSGVGLGMWALYPSDGNDTSGPTPVADVDCENAKRLAGRLSNQTFSQFADNCQLAVTSIDLCEGDYETVTSCVPKAPVTVDNPFSNVGEISTASPSPIHALNMARRQYKFSNQAAPNAEAFVTFYSKKIKSTDANNSVLCNEKFEARGWTVGNRVNPNCRIQPAPSGSAKNGMLACQVSVSFISPSSYLENNCYVLGNFIGSGESVEVVQILAP